MVWEDHCAYFTPASFSIKTVCGQVPYGVRATALSKNVKKIENSFVQCGGMADMSYSHGYENMVDAVDLNGEPLYSNNEFEDVLNEGDRYDEEVYDQDDEGFQPDGYESESGGDFTEDSLSKIEVKKNSINSIVDKIEEDESRNKLQNPDLMEYIRKPIPMPSRQEMNACWEQVLQVERDAKACKFAIAYIKRWVSKWLESKKKRDELAYQQKRIRQLALWKKSQNMPIGIAQLGSSSNFEMQFSEMMTFKNNELILSNKEAERIRMIEVEKHAEIARVKKAEAQQASYKVIEAKKKGMNKNSKWHADRKNQSLAVIKQTNVAVSFLKKTPVNEAGTGKRAMRKIRIIKEAEEQKKLEERLALVKVTVISLDIDIDEAEVSSEEQTEEEKKIDEEAMMAINDQCISIVEAREAREKEEKKAEEEKKKEEDEEKKEEDRFILSMTKTTTKKSQAPKKEKKVKVAISLGFISLIEQKKMERGIVDGNFSKRSEAFADLSDKTKLDNLLIGTTLCKSVQANRKCFHKNCRFAHSISELKPRECRFGEACGFVKKIENGQYKNHVFGKTGKTCPCMHPGENTIGLCIRMGVKHAENTKMTSIPITPSVITPAVITPSVITPSVIITPAVIIPSPVVTTQAVSWSLVVYNSLSEKEKQFVYGKGREIVLKQGHVEGSGLGKHTEGIINPIKPSDIRKQGETHGIGYTGQPSICVSDKNFSWVKGKVLEAQKQKISKWDVKAVHIVAIDNINNKIEEFQKTVSKAKAKAVEINTLLKKEEKPVLKPEQSVYKVPRKKANMVLLSLIRSGVLNFRIEYSD